MSTNRGISCFNPETEKFRNFTEADGLQSNQFNTSSCYRTSDGEMYFGGINGLTTFRPELLQDNPYTPSVVITKLQLFNKTVRPDDETGILSKNISDTESITLKSWQTAFSLEFVVSNYISGQHNTFAYKLDGYDKEWYYLTDRHPVSYSNLPQGTYHFMVKAANNDGKWNTTPTVLEIVILPCGTRPGGLSYCSLPLLPALSHSYSASSGCARKWKQSLKSNAATRNTAKKSTR